MRTKKLMLIVNGLLLTIFIKAETQTFDIATFIPPAGWERSDSNNKVAFYTTSTNNGITTFCQIYLYPSRKSNGNAAADFAVAWKDLVVANLKTKNKPKTETKKQPDGWTTVTGATNLAFQGANFTCMLVTVSGFGKALSVLVNVTGENYAAAINDFFEHLDLDKNGTVSNNQPNNMRVSTAGIDSYSFIAPANWTLKKGDGFLLYSQFHTPELACHLTIIAPQPSSGNLDTDVKNIFNQMYPGWRFYYSDARHDELLKGNTKQGLPYCIMEAEMVRDRPGGGWDYERGSAMVVGMGKQVAVISTRHEPTGIHCQCKQNYAYWGNFFNSFAVRNISSTTVDAATATNNMIGSWMVSGNSAIGEYVFAANGHYQYIGGYGTVTQVTRDMIEIKSSAFQGDGSYSITNDQVVLKKKGDNNIVTYRFRFEKSNKGSTGWKDRICLLNEHPADGGKPYEVCYERSAK